MQISNLMFFSSTDSIRLSIPDPLTADWLNRALQEQGILQEGNVLWIHQKQALTHHHSRILYLNVRFSSDAFPALPQNLVIKIRHRFEGQPEGAFYQLARQLERDSLLPALSGMAEWDSGETMLLLEDLQTHYRLAVSGNQVLTGGQWSPEKRLLSHMLQTLACFHADWWEAPELVSRPDVFSKGGWWGRDSHFLDDQAGKANELRHFLSTVTLDSAIIDTLNNSINLIPELNDRLKQQPKTCVTGDCFPWHFFIERYNASVKIFDLEFVGVNSPAHDLVSLLTYWQGNTEQALKDYHQRLLICGVNNYQYKDLLRDIRLLIHAHTLLSMRDHQRGCSPSLWMNRLNGLQRLLDSLPAC